MNISRRWWVWAACLFALLIALSLWRYRRGSESPKLAEPGTTETRVAQSAPSTGQTAPNAEQSSTKGGATADVRSQQMQRDIAAKNVPISFWGQVVDQDGAPLAGVRIVLSVRQWRFSAPSGISAGFPKSEVISDAGGRFQLTEVHGDNLTVASVQKEGYRLSPKAPKAFSYGETSEPFVADVNNPVIIRMVKEASAEALKTFRASKMISCDGIPIAINLLEGKLYEGDSSKGDLIVSFERNPRQISVSNRDPFDWRITITAPSGGIQPANDELAYVAPVEGYEKTIEIDMPKTAAEWMPIKKLPLFMKGPDGRFFASVTMEIRANYEGTRTGFSIVSTINPSGSRNLQPTE